MIHFIMFRLCDKTDIINWQDFKRILTTKGETISTNDLDVFIRALLGNKYQEFEAKGIISEAIFCQDVLGFESS